MSNTEIQSTVPVDSLSDLELQSAIASEVCGWKNTHRHTDGRLTAEHPMMLTTVPWTIPEWTKTESGFSQLEETINRSGKLVKYRSELTKISRDLNPTLRQRCEAALQMARNTKS